MPVNKVEMSLDDIIKENKKKEQKEKSEGKRGGQGGKKRGAVPRRSGGIAKKQGASPQKKGVRGRGPVRAQQGGSRPLANKFKSTQKAGTTQATKKLVQKLVKKALRTNLTRTQPVVRNVVRRGGVRIPRKVAALNRVSAKSRVIGRRQPITAPVVRGRGQVAYQRNPPAIIRRRTIIRPVQVVEPARRFNRKQNRQFAPPPNSIRGQLLALRQQQQQVRPRQRVVYIRQQPQPRQQVVYVQQQPPRRRQQQVIVQRRQAQPQFFRQQQQPRRNNRFRGNNNNNDPFYTPPNFLQRV